MAFNQLPDGHEGPQQRRTEFGSEQEKLAYDARNLVKLARTKYGKENVTVRDALDLASRNDDDLEALRKAIAIEIKGKPLSATEVNDTETSLERDQVEWVITRIEAGYEDSKATIKLKEGDKPVPEREAFIRSALKGLTKLEVEFMMKNPAPFAFKVKPKYGALSRTLELIDAQPKTMSIPGGQEQQAMKMWPEAEKHLLKRSDESKDKITDYEWEFVQDQQIIEPFPGDDLNKTIGERALLFKQSLPKGMRGTDHRTATMLMAEGLRKGKPLDCKFPHDAKDTTKYEEWLFTVLDEEGEFLTSDKVRCLVGGSFNPGVRFARLGAYVADGRFDGARFRASVSGLVEA